MTAMVIFTSQPGQQSSAEEEEEDGEAQDDKRKSESEFYPSLATGRWNPMKPRLTRFERRPIAWRLWCRRRRSTSSQEDQNCFARFGLWDGKRW